MSQAALQIVNEALGAGGASLDALTFGHMIVRAVVIYSLGLVIVRLGRNRLLGRTTAFDIVLAFILGSLLSRSINGVAPPLPSLAAAAVLVLLHWLVSFLTLRSRKLERLVKGTQAVLMRNGELDRAALRHQEVSEYDILETLRLRANQDDLDAVRNAYLERNGEISIVMQPSVPRVVDLGVRKGVQTIRVELAR